jgi:hypothetical protein
VEKGRATQVGDQTYRPDQAKLRQLSDEGGEAPVQVSSEAHEPEPSLARWQAHPAPRGYLRTLTLLYRLITLCTSVD